VAVQESVVQTRPSLQDWVPPPPLHWPERQVLGFVQVSPEHEPAAQVPPSIAGDQVVVLVAGVQVWQTFNGFLFPVR
jgi:hypothetical protein